MLWVIGLLASVQPGVTWWCTHALHNVFRDTPPPTEAVREVRVSAAKNQRVGSQIVLRVPTDGRIETVECSALRRQGGRGSVPANAFWYAFVEYHRATKNSTHTPREELVREAPADYPDGLLEERAIDLRANENQPIYVRWHVPADTPAGEYRGTITIRTNAEAIQIPVRLTVYNFVFPERPRLKVTIWMNDGALARHHRVEYLSEGFWQILQRTARLMRQHHQNTIWTPWSLMRATRKVDGKVHYDFSAFDRWVETFLNEGFEVIELHHVGGREHGQWEDRNFVAWPLRCDNEASGQTEWLPVDEWLPALQKHLREKGWLQRALLHVADEPIEVNVDSWKQLSERVKRLAPDLPRIDAIHVPNLEGYLEVWVPQLNYLEQWYDRYRRAQSRGAELWFYVAWVPQGKYPNRLLDYPLIKTRVMHWLNHLTETTGFLHWGYNFWDAGLDDQLAPGDNWIVYPGKDAPRGSLRYEAMREGIEDYEYLCLLEDNARQVAERLKLHDFDARQWAKGFTRLVAPGYTTYTRSPERLYAVRDAVARAIEALQRRDLPVLAWVESQDDDTVWLRGATLPEATVSCAGVRARADRDGTFRMKVPRPESGLLDIETRHERMANRIPVAVY